MKSVIDETLLQLERCKAILAITKREHELIELVCWAEQKRLSGVRRAYKNRLADEERRLFRYSLHNPRLTYFLTVAYRICRRIAPKPRYHAKGSAAKYRRCNLTQTHRMQYSALQIT